MPELPEGSPAERGRWHRRRADGPAATTAARWGGYQGSSAASTPTPQLGQYSPSGHTPARRGKADANRPCGRVKPTPGSQPSPARLAGRGKPWQPDHRAPSRTPRLVNINRPGAARSGRRATLPVLGLVAPLTGLLTSTQTHHVAKKDRRPIVRLQTGPPVYPNSSPGHRVCNFLTPPSRVLTPSVRVHRWIRD